jgi:hypothetical protein
MSQMTIAEATNLVQQLTLENQLLNEKVQNRDEIFKEFLVIIDEFLQKGFFAKLLAIVHLVTLIKSKIIGLNLQESFTSNSFKVPLPLQGSDDSLIYNEVPHVRKC